MLGAVVAAVLLTAAPAQADNPVLDPADDTDVAAALAEATKVQGVCYGYVLSVDDADTGQWGGTYAASSAGAGVPASTATGCENGVVELVARIAYASSYSEAEDSASWDLVSSLPALSIGDVEGLGLSSGDLLDDDRSAAVLLNAVQALPRLATEQAGLPPLVLEPNTAPLPADAEPTGTPGSDWLRQNGVLLLLCAAAIGSGLVALWASRPRGRPGRPRATGFGPPPPGPAGRPPPPGPAGRPPGPASAGRPPGPASAGRPPGPDPWRT